MSRIEYGLKAATPVRIRRLLHPSYNWMAPIAHNSPTYHWVTTHFLTGTTSNDE